MRERHLAKQMKRFKSRPRLCMTLCSDNLFEGRPFYFAAGSGKRHLWQQSRSIWTTSFNKMALFVRLSPTYGESVCGVACQVLCLVLGYISPAAAGQKQATL